LGADGPRRAPSRAGATSPAPAGDVAPAVLHTFACTESQMRPLVADGVGRTMAHSSALRTDYQAKCCTMAAPPRCRIKQDLPPAALEARKHGEEIARRISLPSPRNPSVERIYHRAGTQWKPVRIAPRPRPYEKFVQRFRGSKGRSQEEQVFSVSTSPRLVFLQQSGWFRLLLCRS
jgi:hypothetical protein